MRKRAITLLSSEYSYDQASEDYIKTFVFRSLETWSGLAPFALTLWTGYYSESGRRGEHWYYHKNYEHMALEIILEGDVFYEQNGVKTQANAGDIYIVRPGTDTRISSGKSPYRRKLVVLISGNLLGPLLKSLNLEDCVKIIPEELSWFEKRFRKLGEFLEIKNPESAAEISIRTYELIAGLAKEHNRNFIQELPPPLRKMVITIDSNLDKEFSVPFLAAKFNISAPTLTRMFRKHLKSSPGEYLIKRRMENAKQLILTGQLSFKEIAVQVGYQDSRYFSTAFKKYTGRSPSKFRKESAFIR